MSSCFSVSGFLSQQWRLGRSGGMSSLGACSVRCQWESQQSAAPRKALSKWVQHKMHFLYNPMPSPFKFVFVHGANLTQTLPQSFPPRGARGTTCCLTLNYHFHCNTHNTRKGPEPPSEITYLTHLLSVHHTRSLVPLWYIPSVPFMTGATQHLSFSFIHLSEMISLCKESHLWIFPLSSSCAAD